MLNTEHTYSNQEDILFFSYFFPSSNLSDLFIYSLNGLACYVKEMNVPFEPGSELERRVAIAGGNNGGIRMFWPKKSEKINKRGGSLRKTCVKI